MKHELARDKFYACIRKSRLVSDKHRTVDIETINGTRSGARKAGSIVDAEYPSYAHSNPISDVVMIKIEVVK